MKKLIFKSLLYVFLLVLALEIWVRLFYLGKDTPHRYVDEYKVEKWIPNQNGFSITGNRRQNFSEYRINNFGFNSYHEYKPTKGKVEIALVGDSFIEGFHQNHYNSIGKKIENKLKDVEVYEYGYAGYDLADQLHLINVYKKHFDLIDNVFINIKFSTDLERGSYDVINDRMHLEGPLYSMLKKSKLIVYLQSIGGFEPFKDFVFRKKTTKLKNDKSEKESQTSEENALKLQNFKSLITLYGFDKTRFTFLLDSNEISDLFLTYLKNNNYKFIDFGVVLEKSKKPTTLIYDRHWNNHGRDLIATSIIDYYERDNE